jgi:hypothetical protein
MENFQELAKLEVDALNKKITELESENSKLKKVIVDNDLEDEIDEINVTSIEEQICVNGIRHINQLVESQDYDDKDIKNFDTLYRTLRSIRGYDTKKIPKIKAGDVKGLLKIVDQG